MPASYKDVSILLVEDDEVDIRGIKRGLQKQQISNPVYVATNGIEALHMLRGTAGQVRLPRPYLILLDLNMPRMNGIQFLKEIRNDEELSNSIVFVLTTSNNDQDKVAAYREHIAGYLIKSEAGKGFLRVIQMIQHYVLTVQFPPEPH